MAFYGSGAGLTNLVAPYQNTSTTSSDRSLSGSWVVHLSINGLSVPSGMYGVLNVSLILIVGKVRMGVLNSNLELLDQRR